MRKMRTPDGSPVPYSYVETALRHNAGMRHYSIALGRFLEPGEVKSAIGSTTSIGTWQNLGPGNIGGRTYSIAINPQDAMNIYAASGRGGVWITQDGGNTWMPPSADLPPNAINSLVIDPQNPKVVYAGTGSLYCGPAFASCDGDAIAGNGIWKTTNGGASWTTLAGTTNGNFTFVYQMVFGSKHNLYAATATGVWRSTDGGATWTQPAGSPQQCQAIAARSDSATETLIASCATDSNVTQMAIFRNSDAGGTGTWTSVFTQPNMWTTSLAVAPSNQTTMYALSYTATPATGSTNLLGLYQSTDGGATWHTQTTGSSSNRINTALLSGRREVLADVCTGGKPTQYSQGALNNVLAVDPTNANIVWAGSSDVFRSDDGGLNFGVASYWDLDSTQSAYAHSDLHALAFDPGYNGTTNQNFYMATDGGIYMSANSRQPTQTGPLGACSATATPVIAWDNLNQTYLATEFVNGAVYPGGAAYFGGTQDNGTIRGYIGSTENWRSLTGGDGGFVAFDPKDPNFSYAEYVKETTYRARNGFSFFGIGQNIPADNFLFYKPVVIDPVKSGVVYTAGQALWRSADAGSTFTQASPKEPNPISAIAVAPSNSNVVYMGDIQGNVYSTQSAGTSNATTAWTTTLPQAGYISTITIDPTNPQHVYVGYSSYSRAMPANGKNVWASTDGGAHWTLADGSGTGGSAATTLPGVPVTSLVIDPKTNTVYAGTDLGIYLTMDGGLTWSKDANPFYNVAIGNLALDASSGVTYLYAFTFGRSAWRTALPNSGTACAYKLSTASLNFPAAGGTLPVTVTTGLNCAVSAIPVNGAALIQSPATVKATAAAPAPTIYVTMPPNIGIQNQAITDQVVIQGQVVNVTQPAQNVVTPAILNNDLITSPVSIGNLPYSVLVNPAGYTNGSTDIKQSCAPNAGSNSAWYGLVAQATGQLQIFVANGTATAYPVSATTGIGAETACVTGAVQPDLLTFPAPGSSPPAKPLIIPTTTFNIVQGVAYVIEVTTLQPNTPLLFFAAAFVPNTYITVTTPASTLVPGQTVQATAKVVGLTNQAVRWSISPALGTISDTGLYTAPATLTGSAQVAISATSFLDASDNGSTIVLVNGSSSGNGPVVPANGATNAASGQPGPVAPGELVTIYGTGFGPAQLTTLALGGDGKVTSTLAGTQVLFDGVASPMVYAVSGQVSAVVPFGVAGQTSTVVQVVGGTSRSNPVTLGVAQSAPAIFTANQSGSGLATVLNQDGSINSAQHPAAAGSVIVFYATGGGAMNPGQSDGEVTKALASPVLPAAVSIGGANAPVLYFGAAPGFVAGVLQANVMVPVDAPSGLQPMVLTVGTGNSAANVTVWVK